MKAVSLIANASALLLFISSSSSKEQPFTSTLCFPLAGDFGGKCGDLVTNLSLGCEDEHLEPSFSPGTAWTTWESRPTSGFASCPMKYEV